MALDQASADLADAIEQVLPAWVERSVARLLRAAGRPTDPVLVEQSAAAGARAVADIGPRIRYLLGADVADQRSTPLSVLRDAVRYPSEVLAAAGVPPVPRDEVRMCLFPDDDYDLAPSTFADVDPALAGPGLMWGATKAATVLARSRP